MRGQSCASCCGRSAQREASKPATDGPGPPEGWSWREEKDMEMDQKDQKEASVASVTPNSKNKKKRKAAKEGADEEEEEDDEEKHA